MHEDDDARLEIALETSDGAWRVAALRAHAPRPPRARADAGARRRRRRARGEPRAAPALREGGAAPAALRGPPEQPRARAWIRARSSSSAGSRCAAGKARRRRALEQRVTADLESAERAACHARRAANYSRHFSARRRAPPATLLDYLPPKDDWLLLVDESHLTVPQLAAMARRAARAPRASACVPGALPARARRRERRARALLLAQVRGRREAQALAHRARLPAAVGGRQPAAHGARVLGARAAGRLRLGDARRRARNVRPQARRGRARAATDRHRRPARRGRRLVGRLRGPPARAEREARGARRAQPRDVPHAPSAEELAPSTAGRAAAWLHAGVKAAERVLALDALRRGETDALVGCDLLCASASGDEAERGPRPPVPNPPGPLPGLSLSGATCCARASTCPR